MKKISKLLIFTTILAILVAAFVSCEENRTGVEVTEEIFRQAFDITDKNLTIDMSQEYDGHTEVGVLKFVDQKGYMKSNDDTLWYDETEYVVEMLGSLVDCYSSFTFAEGEYTAESVLISLGSDDKIEAKNLSVKINSDGELLSLYFEVPQEKGNIVFEMTFSKYGDTKAPATEEIYVPGSDTNAPGSSVGELVKKQIKVDFFFDGIGTEIDEKQWVSAFEKLSGSYYAEMKMDTPYGIEERQYLVGDGKSYCSKYDSNSWTMSSDERFTEKIMFLAGLFSECSYVDGNYICSEAYIDAANNSKIVDLSITFDEKGRIVSVFYAFENNGQRGEMSIRISTYDKIEMPSFIYGGGSFGGTLYPDGSLEYAPGGDFNGELNSGTVTPDGDGNLGFGTIDPDNMTNIQIQISGSMIFEIVDPDGNVIGTTGGGALELGSAAESFFSPLYPEKEHSKDEDKNEKEE